MLTSLHQSSWTDMNTFSLRVGMITVDKSSLTDMSGLFAAVIGFCCYAHEETTKTVFTFNMQEPQLPVIGFKKLFSLQLWSGIKTLIFTCLCTFNRTESHCTWVGEVLFLLSTFNKETEKPHYRFDTLLSVSDSYRRMFDSYYLCRSPISFLVLRCISAKSHRPEQKKSNIWARVRTSANTVR